MKKKLAIIIPAYNESKVIGEVISGIPKKIKGVDEMLIIVVNDHSTDMTAKVAKSSGAVVLTHKINLGAGGATVTGLEYARRKGVDVAVTLDADGQHDPTEIGVLVERIIEGYDLVIGSRLLNHRIKEMPLLKFFGNNFLNIATFLFYRIWVTDSQSGFRAFSKTFLNKCKIQTAGYEFCSEVVGRAKEARLKMCEVPIKTIYTDYSKSKGQHYLNGFNIIIRLALSKLRGNL